MGRRLRSSIAVLAVVAAALAAACGDAEQDVTPVTTVTATSATPAASGTPARPTPAPPATVPTLSAGNEREIPWSEAVDLIMSCEVTSAMQAHSLQIWLELRDGSSVTTTEPRVDVLFDVVRAAREGGCDQIPLATE